MAAMLLGNIGSSLLGPLGGWLGSALGGIIDQKLFGGGPEEGPRLDDLTAIRADPGVPLPIVFGADRIPGIVIASTELIETRNKKKVGGKGGLGQKVITYTYHVDIDYMLCEGPILGVGRIWAEGNLIRGTRYELEADTSKNPENIGGIPYPDYYKKHLYSPNLTPWSIVRTYTATDEGKLYVASEDKNQMFEVTPTDADTYLSTTNKVVYWKDTATGYYIPIHPSNGYTGAATIESPPSKVLKDSGTLPFLFLPYTTIDYVNYELFDLGDYYGDNYVNDGSGVVNITSRVRTAAQFGLHDADFFIKVEFFSQGTNDRVDGSAVGDLLGPAVEWHGFVNSPEALDVEFSNLAVPDRTRYIRVGRKVAIWLPVWCNALFDEIHVDIAYKEKPKPGVVRDWPDYWNLYDAINDWSPRAVLAYTGPDNVTVYPGHDTQIPDPTMEVSLEGNVPAYIGRAHVVFDRLELEDYGNRIPNFSFEVVQYDDARIANVLTNLMDRAGIASDYYDMEALPSTGTKSHVMGYTIASKTNFRAAMETILEVFRVDAAEIGNSIVFRPKDRAHDYTIDYTELAAVEAGKKPGDVVKLKYRDPVEMPRSLSINFKDVERSYGINSAPYFRQQGVSVHDTIVEYAAVIPKDIAKAAARDKMRDIWLERTSASFITPHRYVYMYPSDIILIDGASSGNDSFAMKLTTVTRGDNGIIEMEGVLRETTLYVPDDGEVDNTDMDGSTWGHGGITPSTVPYTIMALLDLPPLNDTHNTNGFYVAMGGRTTAWHGAALFRSVDNEASYSSMLLDSDSAVIGQVIRDPLLSADAEYVDYDSKVVVQLFNDSDELDNITGDELFRGYNSCVMGDEVVQFLNATRLTADIWELSVFTRGRRGTDIQDIMSSHTTGETFVLLELGYIKDVGDSTAYIGVSHHYKAVTYGATPSEFSSELFNNTGRRLKPIAPYFITGERNVANDVTISWVRRDRVYQMMHDGADLPNSEAIMQFEIDIHDGASVVRTVVVNDATTYTYLAADQTADGLTPGDNISISIYQMSGLIGRGNEGTALV